MSQIWQVYMCFFLLGGWGKKCEKKTKTLRYEVWGNINAVRRNSFWYISNPFGPSVRFGMFMNLFIFGPRLLFVTLTMPGPSSSQSLLSWSVVIIIIIVPGPALLLPSQCLPPHHPGTARYWKIKTMSVRILIKSSLIGFSAGCWFLFVIWPAIVKQINGRKRGICIIIIFHLQVRH